MNWLSRPLIADDVVLAEGVDPTALKSVSAIASEKPQEAMSSGQEEQTDAPLSG
jgi:hypothetical protein